MYDIYVDGQMYLNEIIDPEIAIKVALTHDNSRVINNETFETIFEQGD